MQVFYGSSENARWRNDGTWRGRIWWLRLYGAFLPVQSDFPPRQWCFMRGGPDQIGVLERAGLLSGWMAVTCWWMTPMAVELKAQVGTVGA